MAWSWRIFAAAGLLALLVFLIGDFPASLAYAWWGSALAPARASGIHGTVWAGSATRVSINSARFTNVSWKLHPWTLVLLRPGYRFRARLRDGYVSGIAALAPDGTVHLGDVEARSDLGGLATLFGMGRLPAAGEVNVLLQRAALSGGRPISARGRASVSDLTLHLGNHDVPLGAYGIVIRTDGKRITGTVQDSGGALRVNGTLSLAPQGNYGVRLALTQRRPDARLKRMLALLGRPDADGSYHVDLRGRL